jgi:hypothetical protein
VVVEGCLRRLRVALEDNKFAGSDRNFKQDIIVLLNYLDTIAIGVQQKLYDENLAYDHTNAIVQKWYNDFLNCGTAKAVGVDSRDYDHLYKWAARWANVEPRFGRRWWQRRWST